MRPPPSIRTERDLLAVVDLFMSLLRMPCAQYAFDLLSDFHACSVPVAFPDRGGDEGDEDDEDDEDGDEAWSAFTAAYIRAKFEQTIRNLRIGVATRAIPNGAVIISIDSRLRETRRRRGSAGFDAASAKVIDVHKAAAQMMWSAAILHEASAARAEEERACNETEWHAEEGC
jgi:hypothetical protein